MKSVYQLFALFMLLCGSAYSQEVSRVVDMSSKYSIIRTVAQDQVLIYNLDTLDNSRFVFCKGGTTRSFLLPAGMIVGDMEIDTLGNAWFCGKKDSNGVVGMFNVVGVFTGACAVHFALFITPPATPKMYPCNLSRLDLAYCGGLTVMAMTGGMQFLNQQQVYPAVVSATYDSVANQWNYCYRYNKNCDKVYTDIAVLEDVIVATATDSSMRNSYMKAFNKANCFPNQPVADQYMDKIYIPNSQSTGPMLIAHTNGNVAATVQYGKWPCSVTSYQIKYNNPPTFFIVLKNLVTVMTNCPLDPGNGDMREIRHCGDTTVFALHHGYHYGPESSGAESWALALHEGYSNMSLTGYWLGLGYAKSLDGTTSVGHPTVSGYVSEVQSLSLSRPDILATPLCHKNIPIAVTHPEVGIETIDNVDLFGANNRPNFDYYPIIETHSMTVICH